MAETKRFTIRLSSYLREAIKKRKGEKSEAEWIKEAIIEKLERDG